MWSIFEQSPLEDETISNAFSSRGIFKVRSDEMIRQYPHVKASVQSNKMVIAIDKSIILLEDELIAKCSFLSFSAEIDVMTISQSGNLIVCGLSNGEVHGIFIRGIPLCNLAIEMKDVHMTGRTFAGIQQIDQHFYITCTNGSIYIISEINETLLTTQLNISIKENESLAFDGNLLEHVTIKRITSGRNLNDIISGVLVPKQFHLAEDTPAISLIAGSQKALYFRESSDNVAKITLPDCFDGVKHIFNLEHIILLLTNSGHLLEVCPFTKMINLENAHNEVDILIDELVIMEIGEVTIELLILIKESSSSEERILKIIEYPSFKCKSELEICSHAWLVQQPKCSVNLYYISGKNLNNDGIPTEIEMTLVSETHPSERFKKLIAKGHLEEAEDFGKQFELCLQPIYEAKAKNILVELSVLDENNPQLLEDQFQKLIDLLARIEDKTFFRNNRMINMPSRKILSRYLNEILKHLDEEADENHILDINEQLHRVETLSIIDPYECDMEWQKFIYHSNLLRVIIKFLKHDIPTAGLIWRRHSSSIIPHLKENDFETLLNLIPSNTEAFNIVQWLRQFVPTICSTYPNMMPFITDWSIQKTRALQYADHWPEIGLEFSTKVCEIYEEVQVMHSDVHRQHERNIAKLKDLINALEDLYVLKKRYKLTLTLDNYIKDSIDETALYIMQRVALDNLQSLVNDFLYPIFHEKGKSAEPALHCYVSFLISNRSVLSNWLERAVTCIEFLHNEDERLECALLVLQNSPVPWPDSIAPLIKLRYSTHPLAQKINTECELQVIKKMKVKYGWPADSASDININLFMQRIIKMDLPDMLNDVRTLTMAAPEIAIAANYTCCYNLIRKGKLDVAYEFFKILQSDKNPKYATDVIELFAKHLEVFAHHSDAECIEEHRNIFEFYKLITPLACGAAQKRLLAIQHRLTLNHKFHLSVRDTKELATHENRLKLLDIGIETIVEQCRATLNVSKFIVSEATELSAALDMRKTFAILRICRRMRCLPLTCALSYALLKSIDCTPKNKDDFIDLALELIVGQIEWIKNVEVNASSTSLMKGNDDLALPLAYELISCAAQKSNDISELMELNKYLFLANIDYSINAIDKYYHGRDEIINEQICKALDAVCVRNMSSSNTTLDVQSTNNVKKRPSVSIFDKVDIVPEQTENNICSNDQFYIVRFVARTLLMLLTRAEHTNMIFIKLRQSLTDEMLENADLAYDEFFESLEQMIKVKIHDIWYMMALNLLDFQKQNNCKIINSDLISLQLDRVFKKMLMEKEVNFIDVFVMLISDGHTEILLEKLSNELKTDQQKKNFLILWEMYNTHLNEVENADSIRIRRLTHYYYMEFCKTNPKIKGKFNADIDTIEQLLKELQNKQIDVNLLEHISRDFRLDYQQLLITQIISILQSQELLYEVKTDAFGDEELLVISTAENMRNLCQPYINEIKTTELLSSKLKHFLDKINMYFYELYLCIIEILVYINAMPEEMQIWTSILQFLKHKMTTRRRNRPGSLETDMWFQSQPDIGVLPKIARYRFPFKPIVEQPLKDILDNELYVDNCESWFPLIQLHCLLKGSENYENVRDFYCMSAVKNSIGDFRAKDDTDTWHLQPTNNAFLKSILRLVKHVHNPGKAFMILYFVSNYAPDGADQVEASHECYKYALENEQLITDAKYKEQLLKIKRKYPILKTQHLLHMHGLTDDKHMRLIEHPTQLIYNLYHHELILKSCTKLNINMVVEEIAQLHNLDLEMIQYELLQKWLSFNAESPSDSTILEDTLLQDYNATQNVTEDPTKAPENVIRANYILSSWPKKKAVQFLVAHIFTSEGSMNTSQRLQMYECFAKLNDGSASFKDMISQRQYITIKCVHELKQLGYNCSLDKFDEWNKIDILKAIWQRNAQNPHALKILANICLGFDIHHSKIWNGILKRMVMYNMLHDLNALVDVLSCQPKLKDIDGLVGAWEYVLMHPLKSAHQRSGDSARDELLHKTLFRIQSCPVVYKLNIMKFAEQYVKLQQSHMACALLIFANNEQNELIKKMISMCKVDNLRKEILDLEDAGISPVILNYALKELAL